MGVEVNFEDCNHEKIASKVGKMPKHTTEFIFFMTRYVNESYLFGMHSN